MQPSDQSRLVNFTQTMVRAPKALPRLLEHIRSTEPSPELAAAIQSLEEGYRELGEEQFDLAAARKLAERLMQEPKGPKRSAGATLLDAVEYVSD